MNKPSRIRREPLDLQLVESFAQDQWRPLARSDKYQPLREVYASNILHCYLLVWTGSALLDRS